MNMWLMVLGMGLSALAVVGLLVAATTVGLRALRERRQDEPLRQLQRRLAGGEIGPDEFFERESAIRSTLPGRRASRA
jgi:hypothetical protein